MFSADLFTADSINAILLHVMWDKDVDVVLLIDMFVQCIPSKISLCVFVKCNYECMAPDIKMVFTKLKI